MFRKVLGYFALPLVLLLSNSSGNSASQTSLKKPDGQTGILEKMIVANGNVTMDLDLSRLNGGAESEKREVLRFQVGPNSFFTTLIFNDALRGVEPSSMSIVPINTLPLPGPLQASINQLIIEKLPSDAPFELAVRDSKTGFVFFNVEGHVGEYDAPTHALKINDGRLLVSEELANKLGRPGDTKAVVGGISILTTMYPIEVNTLSNGVIQSSILPTRASGRSDDPELVPGPDVIVGDLPSMGQFGTSVGTQVGLAVGTTSCNNGTVPLDWFALSNTDHPVIPQNFYRMSGGANNNDRFEQVGQSWLKHAFTALEGDACGLGCNTSGCATGTHLCPGCSDPYDASLNASQGGLGSRAWVNPFTGVYPSTAANHSGHSHTGVTHRVLCEMSDLDTTQNPGATYFAEAQYVTPHEYAWCQSNPGQCNMYNNASYRRFTVSGTTSFNFSAVGNTVRMQSAINAWTGATINAIEPAPGVDGRAFMAYKVSGPVSGVWHYEYAIYNQNLDRAIQSFSVPIAAGTVINNIGFHAPPNHPGIANDGTQGDAGFSNAPWISNQAGGALIWNSETFAQNQNANAIRWGTMYNFRFDSPNPPQATNATVGFYKTGAPITVAISAPAGTGTPTPTATGTPPPTTTPTATATATATPCMVTSFSENFDAWTPPLFPPGWVATNIQGGSPLWVTSNTSPDTSPVDAFIDDPGSISDKLLDTLPILISAVPAQITFRSNYNLESSFDGGVLELSINNGPFNDVIAAGGSFVTGGYNDTISTDFQSPIGGRGAWSGSSGGYITSKINLPAGVAGQNIKLRFRMASDNSVSSNGWRVDTLTISVAGPCGTPSATPPVTPSASPTATATGSPCSGTVLDENFDGVTAPALPSGWSATGDQPTWVTSTITPDTAPNDAFVDDPPSVTDKRLESPNIAITSASAQLSFRNFYFLESTFDGGVLEVSSPNINGGAFTDVTNAAVGGSFATGGYNATISTSFQSPIAGRMAWSGNAGGYTNTVANLGPNVAGQTIRLRFRMASDNSVSATGWRIDSVRVTGGACPSGTPQPTPSGTSSPPPPSPTASCGGLTQGFDDITTLPGLGWVMTNHSGTVGTTNWFQGNDAVFPAQSGGPTSYIGANFNNTTGTDTISNWLLTPPVTLANGQSMTFYTRTVDAPSFPDRLQVRMSTNGASSNVGTTATDVGDFTTLLLDINPTYTTDGYPNAWTQFTVTVTGVPSPTLGRFAFRYFVENAGPNGANSDYIGIDTFAIAGNCEPSPSPTASPTPSEGTPTATATVTTSVPPSPTATATTSVPPTVQALNLSTRMQIETGDNVGIGGFIVTGTDPKPVLLRAIGPSLGVPGALADPVMELHGPAGFQIITNDNWREPSSGCDKTIGIPPTNDLESAICADLAPGAYTAIVRGNNNGTGIGLVEIYDLDSAANSKLANISTRAFVQTGDNIMIAGFILGGNGVSDNFVLRGLGPSVPGALADPNLELRNSEGALIIANNDWMDDPKQAAVIKAVGLTPPNASDSAIAATLGPGFYTALLTGRNNGTGIGLVEVYDIGPGAPIPTPTPGTPSPTATVPSSSPTPSTTIAPTATPTATATPGGGSPCMENFDSVTAPALPPGWVASNPDPGDGTLWATATTNPASPPNSLFLADQDGISDKVVDRVVNITSASPVISFRNNFNTEFSDNTYWDGYVLEVSAPNISSGDFLDITDSHVGGSFVSGGYTGLISSKASNPLSGRMAWSSDSGGYIDTVINMGPNLVGQTVTLRFRMGSDEAVAAPGVWIDNISISGGTCP